MAPFDKYVWANVAQIKQMVNHKQQTPELQ
jgi:hypothetical protein